MITKDSKSILLADDSIFFRTKLSSILVEAGHRVKFANDGRDVIRELEINPKGVDLLILDLQMPNIDGFGVLEWMNDNYYTDKIPVLAVTGVYEAGAVIGRLKSLGAKGLMTKGFTPEQVVFWINKILFPERHSERKEDRVPVSVAADFTVSGRTSTGFLLNISTTGLFLHSREELLPGTVLAIKFTLPGSEEVISAKGIVKWVTSSSAQKSLFGGAGMKFTNISEEDEKAIKEFIEKELKRFDIRELEPARSVQK